jgi:site-specific DNA recombinase
VLAGEGLHAIVTDWAQRRIPTPEGHPVWWRSSLRRLLLRPRIAGLREHQGVIVGPAVWPAIIDPAAHERLRAVLNDPARLAAGGQLARKYLLTGFAYCGRSNCGKRLIARPYRDKRRAYACSTGITTQGCGCLTRLAEPVEALVREELFAALDSTDFRAAVRAAATAETTEQELLGRLQAEEQALAEAQLAHFAERVLDRAGFLHVKQYLEVRIEETRRALARLTGSRALASLPASIDELRATWETASLSWRRTLVRTYIDRVVLLPYDSGRRIFRLDNGEVIETNPDKVEPIWLF